MPSAMGLIRVVGNGELQRREQQEAERQAAWKINTSEPVQGLAKHVTDCWQDARTAKQSILPRMRRAHRARMGEYDTGKLAEIREFGGSEEYARISANKCRIVEAWLRDVFLGQSEKPWTLHPTPKPDFPPDTIDLVKRQISAEVAALFGQTGQIPQPDEVRAMMARYMDDVEERLGEEARIATRRMEDRMEDQLAQGGFIKALGEFIADLTVYPSAILKGPVLRRRKMLTWENAKGHAKPLVVEKITTEFERVDPFRAYPSAGASTPQEGFFIQHHTFSYSDLYDMIGSPGFNEEAIRAVLRESAAGSLQNWMGLTEVMGAEPSADDVPEQLERKVFDIDALEFYGSVKGKDLLDWGVEDVEDPDAAYDACVWLIGKWVIKAQLNYDPLGARPFYKTSYENLPGEFWGFGIPDVLNDIQGIVNAAVRALVNNMGLASGPQIGINVDRLPPGEDLEAMRPLRIWQLVESQYGSKEAAIQFFQPNSNARELLDVIENFYRFADDFSLVPRYMAGSDKVAGAGRTASGLSMLMDAANKGLKGVVSNIDVDTLKPLLERLYTHNMLYDEDETIKGDAQIIARGAVSLMQLETLQLRRNEFLQITANPIDSQIVGIPGRAEVLREVARGLELDTNRIVPSREKLEQMAMPPEQGAPQQQGGGLLSHETLGNGAATTDNFSPSSMTP
jgi:hypothetical protein